ncbi:MAG TPA: glycosyltransferase family 2 protein [Oscillatoriales cyanobacterium M59_W2019_021]|nr:MAG: glycosyltransferase family 2 protein [Cyanobacteria bacterium J055]HIK30244.1 glycosyltransferase family 2 protein [Oscillatoriales cyanobacterium M4454_W2019_049]HIK49855.1 glycosyltransferase family 2 protein [Oscillatoriales cyanobacterium M59_W2019_021]
MDDNPPDQLPVEIEGEIDHLELSIVMPCLNEAETLGICIQKARDYLARHGIAGEIIVADNGSTDGSPDIALKMGARVVRVRSQGYGSALAAGIAAARGQYVIMGDADDSYDFSDLTPFLEKLRSGYDLVMGNRFKGGIQPGAMPPLHQYLGNPLLTGIGRLFFPSPCGDFHCGLRGFRKAAIDSLDLRTTGMEFASEMVVKASLYKMRITEVPTTLSPDGRSRPPHLRSWRDGWRHLRFLLLYSPRWLFLYPGLLLVAAGLAVGLWLLPGPQMVFDIHTLLFAATAIIVGFQAVAFAIFTKVFAMGEGLLPKDRRIYRLFRYVNLELGLLLGGGLFLLGLAGSIYALGIWGANSFGPLDPARTMRIAIPSVTAVALGFEIVLSSFFLSVLGLKRR